MANFLKQRTLFWMITLTIAPSIMVYIVLYHQATQTSQAVNSLRMFGALNATERCPTLHNPGNSTLFYTKDIYHLTFEVRYSKEKQQLEAFLTRYEEFCRQEYAFGCSKNFDLCPCIPANLVGRRDVTQFNGLSPPTFEEIARAHSEMMLGGQWKPSNCTARQRIAVIIPYKDREHHLRIFLHYMIPFLQRQLLEFRIFVTEQASPSVFNKASVMNVGFLEAKKLGNFDCYIFHDVDALPEDDRNFYTCTDSPRHFGHYVKKYKYRPPLQDYIGLGSSFSADQFEKINGFSNKFYGWGGEDIDAYYRIQRCMMLLTRYPIAVARYTTLDHGRDQANPYSVDGMGMARRKKTHGPCVDGDGLNSVTYNISSVEHRELYTWINVHLPPMPGGYQLMNWEKKKQEKRRAQAARKKTKHLQKNTKLTKGKA